MARIRSVKPEFWHDRKLAKRVSRDARLLYIGLWNQADEHARLNGDPQWVRGQVFPFDDDLTHTDVDRMLKELEEIGAVVRYEVDDDPYIFLPKLARHQRLEPWKVESRIPAPPCLREYESEPRSDESEPRSEQLRLGSDESAPFYVAGSMEHVAGSREHDSAARAPQRRATRIPDDFAVTPQMVAWARENAPNVNGKRETEKFIDYWQSKAGKDALKLDWVKAWQYWMRNAEDRAPRSHSRASPPESTTDQRVAQAQALKESRRHRRETAELPPNTIPGSVIRD